MPRGRGSTSLDTNGEGGALKIFTLGYEKSTQPELIAALQAGETVTFNYVPTGEVWKKRVSGRFLEVSTRPITLSRDCLQVEGRTVPTSTLRDVDVGTWTQNVTLNDATGSTVFSTMGVGILSFDLFLETVSWLVQDAQR